MSEWRSELKTWEDKINYVFKNKLFTDVSLIASKNGSTEVFPAHQFVLVLASDYFESNLKKKGKTGFEINLNGTDPQACKLLLNYIYCNEVTLSSLKDCINMYEIADKFSLTDLKEICLDYIEDNINISTCCTIKKFAEDNDMEYLNILCTNKIQTQTKEILSKPNLPTLNTEAILMILDQSMLNIIEYDLFKAVMAWLELKGETKGELDEELTNTIVKKFCFLNMSAQQFAEGPGKSRLLTQKQFAAVFSNITGEKNSKPYPTGFCTKIRDSYQELSFETSRFKYRTEPIKVASIFFTVDKTIYIKNVRLLSHIGNNNEKYKERATVRIMQCAGEQFWDWKNVAEYTNNLEVQFSDSFYINFDEKAMIEQNTRHSITLEFNESNLCRTVDLHKIKVTANEVEFSFSKYNNQPSSLPISSICFDQ
ncbi:BTB/POZ domain-containing protein 3-like [Cimex lectularius]|uniref:BTB domain-containing protein n=1 Tax=Cimex lectularius TaxID=79782 RepID=A0A8I6R806_CIMLE|nr:BTB/POZ domain-containing protein 3-like [Cimex lectularius]